MAAPSPAAHAGPSTTLAFASTSQPAADTAPSNTPAQPKKKRKKHGNKKRRNRRQSFASPLDQPPTLDMNQDRPSLRDSAARSSFYRLSQGIGSNTSLDSNALLDHRYVMELQLRWGWGLPPHPA